MPDTPTPLPSASFRFCPRCGHGPSAPPPAPVFACAACGFHFHFNPAVAAGVIVEDGEVYFTGRARDGSTASARHEVEAVRWLRPDEIVPAELAFPTTRAAFARYRETLGVLPKR